MASLIHSRFPETARSSPITSLMLSSPFKYIDLRPPPVQLLLLRFGFFLCYALLLFSHRFRLLQVLDGERRIKRRLFVVQVDHTWPQHLWHNERHHRVAISDVVMWRFRECEQLFLDLCNIEQVF